MQYLISVIRPNGWTPDDLDADAMMREIDAVNAEMVADGVRQFVGGLQSTELAKSIRPKPDGSLEIADGPVIEATQFLNGLWVLEVADEQAALEWGRRAAIACRASIEVRPFH